MSSFSRLATVTASTKRSGGIVSGLEVGYVTHIASLKCLPLDPITVERKGGHSVMVSGVEGLGWHEVLQTSTEGGLDIIEGDLLVVGSVEYPIRAVANWTWRGSEYKRLLLQEIK